MVTTALKPSAAMLREIKLLQVFTEPELAKLIQDGQMIQYEAHSNVVIEGELSWGIYLILQGTLGVIKNNKLTGDSYDVGQLKQGTFFGEMSLIDDNPRSATVKALTDCQLFYISKEAFNSFLSPSKDLKLKFYESCIKSIVARLRELDDSYVISQYQLWKTVFESEAMPKKFKGEAA